MARKSRRKGKAQARRERAKRSPKALTQRGKAAFDRDDYDAAITAWEKTYSKATSSKATSSKATSSKAATPDLTAALAEAHFRRGVIAIPPSLDDLQRAAALDPTDPRFRYHLGRIHHWRGELDDAIDLYRSLLAEDPPYARAAFPLAQILIAQGQDVTTDLVWAYLSPEEQDCLTCVKSLSTGHPVVALRHAPQNGADALWAGLAGVALGETDAADLQTALDNPDLPPMARAVAHYYLGLLAWQRRDREEALAHWQTARSAGLDTPWLRQNLASAYQLQAQEHLEASGGGLAERLAETYDQTLAEIAEAQRLADLGLKLLPDDRRLAAIKRQAHLRLGYAAALSGQWSTALSHWQAANQADKTDRMLLINLALANEKLENYAQAADLWRQALRRRPRKADAPDALSDEQVARMWQHVAENYRKAGDYEEATKVYRNAIKWAPDNVELQLSLTEALMADGRTGAASNIIDEVLEAHPDHVEALAWQAQIYEEDHYLHAAQEIWQKVLALDQQHPQARQHLAHLYEQEGDNELYWEYYDDAIAAYQKGLDYMPHSAQLYASIGLCYVEQGDFEAARQQFERAFSVEPNNLSARHMAIRSWLRADKWNEAQALLEQAEMLDSPPSTSFYVNLADYCQDIERPEWAKRLLEQAEKRNPNDPRLLVEIAVALAHDYQEPRAIGYLRRALNLDPHLADAHLWLGNLYFVAWGQTRLAKRHWSQAERIAQQTGDQAMLFQVRLARDYFLLGKKPFPPPLMFGGPSGDFFDRDEDDDDDYC